MAQAISILDGVHPLLRQRMTAAIAATEARGVPIIVRSGFRTQADQQRLWDARASNPYPVAAVGFSPHEWGIATDVRPINQTASNWQVLWDEAARQGLTLGHNFNRQDNVHFELPGFTHGGVGNVSQPGLAQYGIYRKPRYAGDFAQSAAPVNTGSVGVPPASLPGIPVATDSQPFAMDNDTLVIIVAGIVLIGIWSWWNG